MNLENTSNKNTNNEGSGTDTNVHGHKRSKSLVSMIFGEDVADDTPESQGALSKAIELKIEQERTKQQYYRLENTNKTIELLQLTSRLGISVAEVSALLSPSTTQRQQINNTPPNTNTSNSSSHDTNNKTQQYKFPMTNQERLTAPPKILHRRLNSPARIGANAIASLAVENGSSGSMTIKEEESIQLGNEDEDENENGETYSNQAISPLTKRLPTFHNYITTDRTTRHSRNMSLPSMNKFVRNNNNNNINNTSTTSMANSQNIPETMTSILSFDNLRNDPSLEKPKPESARPANIRILEKSGSQPFGQSKSSLGLIQKKHRRAKSASGCSAFGVIDLNVIEDSKRKVTVDDEKRKAIIANILANGKYNPNINSNTITNSTISPNNLPKPIISPPKSMENQDNDDVDEKTCSESGSSRCASPVRYTTHNHTVNSVQRLLND